MKCPKCKKTAMTMSGSVYLTPDREPYQSGVIEPPRTDITELERYIGAIYCENCDEIIKTFNE